MYERQRTKPVGNMSHMPVGPASPLPLAMPACNLCLANCGHKEIIVAIVGNVIDNSILCIIWVLCADASAL